MGQINKVHLVSQHKNRTDYLIDKLAGRLIK